MTLFVEVFDEDSYDEGGIDDEIDQFTITIPGNVSTMNQSYSLTIQGLNEVGNLTLSYFNITTDPITSSSSAEVSPCSTEGKTSD